MDTFTGYVFGEGGKHYPTLGIPAALSFSPGWVRLVLPGADPCFLFARGHACRIAIPAWAFPNVRVGDTVQAQVEPAQPYRARGVRSDRFDWNAFVEEDDRTFATDEPGGVLRLWNRYSAPFDLLRCPPVEALYWTLGFYQAEGSKSNGGLDFSFANTNAALLAYAIAQLGEIGIPIKQLYAEILQGVGESRESAMAKYAALEPEVTAVRPRSGKGGSAYVLHAHNSKPFRGMICRALAHVFENEFPSRAAARAYAFGWLDGDGTITLTDTDTKLRLAGLPEEHAVMKRALTQVFGWNLSMASTRYQDNKRGSVIGLKAARIIDLLNANAFPFSMNRVRLLLGLARRTRGRPVRAARRRYSAEIEKAQRLQTAEPSYFGVKGAPLPHHFKLKIR
jgi:hypothetical protein